MWWQLKHVQIPIFNLSKLVTRWSARYIKRKQFNVSSMRSKMRSWLRKEFFKYRSSIAHQPFTNNDARSYWYNAKMCGMFPRLTRLARIFSNCRSFINCPRTSDQWIKTTILRRLRSRLKIQTLVRDSGVSRCNAWVQRVNSSLDLISHQTEENSVSKFSKIDTLPFIP